jgi:hypothetical protein
LGRRKACLFFEQGRTALNAQNVAADWEAYGLPVERIDISKLWRSSHDVHRRADEPSCHLAV